MRLTPEQVDIIKHSVAGVFGPGATVRLFGSRVDDQRKGGDIDLYIETPLVNDSPLSLKSRLLKELWQTLGAQRIDVLIRQTPNQPLSAIHQDAIEHGILL